MSPGALVLMSASLAVDAALVSAAQGVAAPALAPRHVAGVGALFGGAHLVMPLTGWLFGEGLGSSLPGLRPWVAFAVLAAVGGKMTWDGLRPRSDEGSPERARFSLRSLLPLAFVTSLDALAVGAALPALEAPLTAAVVTIGATTALLSGLGLLAGRHGRRLVGARPELAGGLVIMGLGLKLLAHQV